MSNSPKNMNGYRNKIVQNTHGDDILRFIRVYRRA